MSELCYVPPEPDKEYSLDDLLDNLKSGQPISADAFLRIFVEKNEIDTGKTLDSCKVNGKPIREWNEVVQESPPKSNRDQKVAIFPDDIVENLKSGHKVKVKVKVKIFHELSAEEVLNILNHKTETGGKKPVMVRQITYPIREKICRLLNIRRMLGNDFRILGGEVGLSNEDIQLISEKENPADEVLKKWETQPTATVETFKEILKKMKRDDVVDLLDGNSKSGMVRSMAYLVRMEVCKKLNVRRDLGDDFRNLAGKLGMSNEDIKLISDKDNPAEEVLTWWETQNSATIKVLRDKLLEIKRSDIEEVLREASQVSCDVKKLSHIGEQMQCPSVFSAGDIFKALEAIGLLEKTEMGWRLKTKNSTERSRNNHVSSAANGYQELIWKILIAFSGATVGGLLVHAIPICQCLSCS